MHTHTHTHTQIHTHTLTHTHTRTHTHIHTHTHTNIYIYIHTYRACPEALQTVDELVISLPNDSNSVQGCLDILRTLHRYTFSKVSSLSYVPETITMKLTFENFCMLRTLHSDPSEVPHSFAFYGTHQVIHLYISVYMYIYIYIYT